MRAKTRVVLLIVLMAIGFYIFNFYSSIVLAIGSADWWIQNHRYIDPTNGSKNVYVIKKNGLLMSFESYKVSEGGIIDVPVAKGTEFAVSLHANSTVAYRWKLAMT